MSQAKDSNMLNAFLSKYQLRVVDLLFILGNLALMVSVFFVWRDTQIVSTSGSQTFTTTAWETGLLGGQGLFILTLLILLIFIPINLLLGKRLALLSRIMFMIFAAAMLVSTFTQVINRNPELVGTITKQHTNLGVGFYVAILGGNLLIFYCIYLLRANNNSRYPART